MLVWVKDGTECRVTGSSVEVDERNEDDLMKHRIQLLGSTLRLSSHHHLPQLLCSSFDSHSHFITLDIGGVCIRDNQPAGNEAISRIEKT